MKRKLGGNSVSTFREQLSQPILAEIAALEEAVVRIKRSANYQSEQDTEASINRQRGEAAIRQRLKAREQRHAVVQAAFDAKVDTFDWTQVRVPSIIDRREIVREHLLEAERRAANLGPEIDIKDEQTALLINQIAAENGAPVSKVYAALRKQQNQRKLEHAFETNVTLTDEETGERRHFTVVTDPDGYRYILPNLMHV